MGLLSMQEIADEISTILKQRARTLDQLGLVGERSWMGPWTGAHWPGGPKIVVRLGDGVMTTSLHGNEVRYELKRGQAEKYLRALRESPTNFEIDDKHKVA